MIAPNRSILEQDIYPVSNITTALPNAGLNMTTCGMPVLSWDCIAGSCIDPGTGLGMYSDEATCLSVCGISAIEDINVTKENNKFTVRVDGLL